MRSYLEDVLDRKGYKKDEEGEESTAFKGKIKTYLIESNSPNLNNLRQDRVMVKDTPNKILKSFIFNKNGKNYELVLDISDERFWMIYSLYDSEKSQKIINDWVLRNDSKLDFVWFPSKLLEKYMGLGTETGFSLKYINKFRTNGDKKINVSMRFWGDSGKDILESLRKNTPIGKGTSLSGISLNYSVEDGFAKENISNFGRFTLLSATSIDPHFLLLDKIKRNYSNIINVIESNHRVEGHKTEFGMKLKSNPLYIEFPKEIENLEDFVNTIFSARLPFRLSGTIEKSSDDFYRIHAVDLHSKGLVDFEIDPNLMAIYLNDKSCGNIIMRLVTNMQSFMDEKIKLVSNDDSDFFKSHSIDE